MKKLLGLATLSLVLLLVLAPSAMAAEFIGSSRHGDTVTLSNGETHRNLYIGGGSVFVNSDTQGDLYAAAGTIIVEKPVEQDVVIAGGTITLNGPIGGDVRILGGEVTINNAVGGDIVMAGGMLRLTEKGTVHGDLLGAGGEFVLDALVTGNVKINADFVQLNSVIGGDANVTAVKSLKLGAKANIPNKLTYHSRQDLTKEDGAHVGTFDFQPMKGGGRMGHLAASVFAMSFIIKVIGLILAGLLLMKLFPRTSRASIDAMHQNKWINVGIGLATLIVGPVIFVLLLISFVGMYIAFMWLFVWLLMLLVATLVACIYVGAWINKALSKKETLFYDWQALVMGVVVIGLIMLVPFIGGLLFFILLMMAFGGIIRQFYAHIKREQSQSLTV